MQQQVGHFQRLFNTRPRRKRSSRWSVLCRSYRIAKSLSRRANDGFAARFIRPEEPFESTSHALRLLPWMCPTATAMQALYGFRTHQTTLRQFKPGRHGVDTFAEDATAHPKQIRQRNARSRSALRLEHVAHIDPGTDLSHRCELSDRREGQRRSPGTLRANNLCEGTNRQSAVQQSIHGLDAGGRGWTDDSRTRRERGRHLVRQCAFKLNPKTGGRSHSVFAISSPISRCGSQPPSAPRTGQL